MKILWVNTNFLHPTTKGGQIRTLEMLRYLHRWHEIHYVAILDPANPEGPARSGEYCFRAYPLEHRITAKNSPAFVMEVARGFVSPLPLAISRFSSPRLGDFLEKLLHEEHFDRAVIDFLVPASYFPDLGRGLLFQHNVETMVWQRHAQHARDPLRRMYFRRQAELMFTFERSVCRKAGHIVAVSAADAQQICSMFGVSHVSQIPTGVNLEYFAPPPSTPRVADLVFIGSMDWLPNVDGVTWFMAEVLPRIRRRKPECTFAIVGRKPPVKIVQLANRDPGILVTDTVPDIRSYLWGASVSVVPLRIGGGTRLKIYESMAARIPVVSTAVGAEGLDINPPENIRIADDPDEFAEQCFELLDDAGTRARLSENAWQTVASRFSWETVARRFEAILETAPSFNDAPAQVPLHC